MSVEKRSEEVAPGANAAARPFSVGVRVSESEVAAPRAEESAPVEKRSRKSAPDASTAARPVSAALRAEGAAPGRVAAGRLSLWRMRAKKPLPVEVLVSGIVRAEEFALAAEDARSEEVAPDESAAARAEEPTPAVVRSEEVASGAEAAARPLSVAARAEESASAAGRAGSWTVCSKRFSPGVSVACTIVSVRSPPISST